MAHKSKLIEANIHKYLKEHENKEILRLLTCGSVDDGKSTLIGRLLYDSKMIFEDQLASIKKDSKKIGTIGNELDLALLVDGLVSEREQGITIDVAYRFFSTDKKKYIVADAPGHEQYTRNMVTGASNANLAIILIDARMGVLTQTKRHSFIVSLLGIRNIIVTINKMDLVNFSEEVFLNIKKAYEDEVIPYLPIQDLNIDYIPISALNGDNIVKTSIHTPWYEGEVLMQKLDTTDIKYSKTLNEAFRFPVQYVNRPHLNFRGYCGSIVSGSVKVGDKVTVLPSKKQSTISSIITSNIKELKTLSKDEKPEVQQFAFSPMAITLTLEDEIDISRGDVLVHSFSVPEVFQHVEAFIVWMSEDKMKLNDNYIIKRATKSMNGMVTHIDYKKDINTFEEIKTNELILNDIAKCKLSFDTEIALDLYENNRYMGGFIIIDKYTNSTVGAGMILDTIKELSEELIIKEYSKAEIELNKYIRTNFPEWNCTKV